MPDRLIIVAHGTASTPGRASTEALVAAVRLARPDTAVELSFLDVIEPRLAATLAALDGRPAVLVPLLLSTGYHVESDIPAACRAHPQVRLARHLGPHPLLSKVLADRLAQLPGASGSVVLVGAGSTRPAAAVELAEAAELLARRIDRPVTSTSVGGHLRDALAGAQRPVHVATYLLTEGQFATTVRAAAAEVLDGGDTVVGEPLGVHPSLVELVWRRYDEAARAARVL